VFFLSEGLLIVGATGRWCIASVDVMNDSISAAYISVGAYEHIFILQDELHYLGVLLG
jgi:hypothetical protein